MPTVGIFRTARLNWKINNINLYIIYISHLLNKWKKILMLFTLQSNLIALKMPTTVQSNLPNIKTFNSSYKIILQQKVMSLQLEKWNSIL